MICGAGLCNAQSTKRAPVPAQIERQVSVVEALPDGGYVVEIDGVKYRAVTDDQLRSFAAQRINLTACAEEHTLTNEAIAKLKAALDLARKDAELATAQTAIEQERAGRFEAMYNGEHNLRIQAEQLSQRGRVSRFLDQPVTQVAIKLGLPLLGVFIRR
jgi:hypothetical protein